jgi:hypothetical protein
MLGKVKLKLAAFFCAAVSVLIFAAPCGLPAQSRSVSLAKPEQGSPQSSQSPAAVAPQQTQAEALPTYPQSADGFNAQMSAAVAAYQAGEAAAGRRLLEQFRLPHSAEWFAQNIGPDQSEALTARYDRLFESYLNNTEKTLQDLAAHKGQKLNTDVKPGRQEPPKADAIPAHPRKLSGIVPAKDPACINVSFGIKQSSKADLLLKGNFKFETWMDTFIYQDGAFRFMGHGAWPFWVWDDHS